MTYRASHTSHITQQMSQIIGSYRSPISQNAGCIHGEEDIGFEEKSKISCRNRCAKMELELILQVSELSMNSARNHKNNIEMHNI